MLVTTFRGKRLARLRAEANLSQSELAYRLRKNHGVKADQSQIANWEKGSYTPRASTVPALAAELGCSMEQLYGDDEDEEADSPMVFNRAVQALAAHGEYDLAAELHREAARRKQP